MKIVLFLVYTMIGMLSCLHSNAQSNPSTAAKNPSLEKPNLTIFSEEFSDWIYQCISPSDIETARQDASGLKCVITQAAQKLSKNGLIQYINISLAPAIDKTGQFKWALLISGAAQSGCQSSFEIELEYKQQSCCPNPFQELQWAGLSSCYTRQ